MASHINIDGPQVAPAVVVAPVVTPELSRAGDELPVFRYSLRHLFWFVTLVCVLLASLVATAGAGVMPLALLLAVLVVALHLTGTALGTRLRAHADAQIARGGLQIVAARPVLAPPLRRSLLRERGFLNQWLPVWVAAGAAFGALAGVGLLAALVGHRATLAGIAVGTVSTSILGGWFAFLAVSTWAIVREGWRESVADHHRDESCMDQ